MSQTRFHEGIAAPAPSAQNYFRERPGSLGATLMLLLLVTGTAATSSAQTFKTLYNFCSISSGGYCLDGQSPETTLIQGTNGNLYGTTFSGGSANYGTVFRLVPSTHDASEQKL